MSAGIINGSWTGGTHAALWPRISPKLISIPTGCLCNR